MPKFEKYHPILTPHYTFDWLTKARAKDVLAFYQQFTPVTETVPTMLTTADRINHTMRDIFHDQKLVWGISRRADDQFIGQAGFDPIDTDQQTATLQVHVMPAAHQQTTLAELYTRLTEFGTQELGLTKLNVTLPVTDTIATQILTALHFRSVPATTTDRITYQLP